MGKRIVPMGKQASNFIPILENILLVTDLMFFFTFFMESFLRDGHNSRAIHEELIGYLCKYLDLNYLVLIQF